MNKRILILTAATGQGHNSVAYSLKKELELQGNDVNCIESFRVTGDKLDKFMTGGYEILATKTPSLFGLLYKVSNHKLTSHGINKLIEKCTKEDILKIIEEYKPNLIISTHPLLVSVVASLKNDGSINVPFISVVTDYKAHRAYVEENVDAYVVGSEYTKESLVYNGVEEKKIHTFGIPVKRDFLKTTANHKNDDLFTILLMGGSMGLKSMKKALKRLMLASVPLRVIAVCGNNEVLKNQLESIYSSVPLDKELVVLGYTNNIPDLMDISDVIITKPGGITVTEALTKKLPLIIPYYIPGQEEENARYLLSENIAICPDIDEIDEIITSLVRDKEKLNRMRVNIEKLSQNVSLENTLALVKTLSVG
ncbi:glycosyltransferase [Clostridium sp. YIM B02551]|uniref:MGDG synthase family glycosyltransferase n=1 Tax=Clostridium sp. YIM B02551 TaxID=2910679 RepID=UPI001EEA4152|nr:glycosyltransferase [Clostridium sp. YIM B02551]